MSLRKSLLLTFVLFSAAEAHAEKVLLYGLNRGCQTDEKLTQAVEQQLTSSAYTVVKVVPDKPLGQPDAAATQLQQQCSGLSGRLLGGSVQDVDGFKRVRLWLVDLATRQTAVLDDYCRDCDIAQRAGIAAVRLTEKGIAASAVPPSSIPTYCASESAAATVGSVRSNKLAVVVYGEPKAKSAVYAAVRTAVANTGREVTQAHAEGRSFGPSDLRKMLREPSGQVLGAELTAEGANLWVFDGLTEKTQPLNVPCAGCDKEELGRKVALSALAVLDTCFDGKCEKGTTPLRPPAEACQPMTEAICGPTGGLGHNLNPTSAKIIKGLTWGAFAVSATTTVALFAANASGAGSTVGTYEQTVNGLVRPALTAAAFTGLSLVVAIPVTILVNKASAGTATSPPPHMTASASIKCPN